MATVAALEDKVDGFWKELATLSAQKKEILDDDLAREVGSICCTVTVYTQKLTNHHNPQLYAAETRLLAGQHADAFSLLKVWFEDKLTYLTARESEIRNFGENHYLNVQTVGEANHQLDLHNTFMKEKTAMTATDVASLKLLGQEILDRRYHSAHSTYTFETPGDVIAREKSIEGFWSTLEVESDLKRPILEDHLARTTYQTKVRLQVQVHKELQTKLAAWCEERSDFLLEKNKITSVADAEVQQSQLEAFRKEMVWDLK